MFLVGVFSCADDSLLTPPANTVSTELTVLVSVQPPTSLRTLDTWNSWNLPVDVAFVAEVTESGTISDGSGDDGHGHPGKSAPPYDVRVPLKRIAADQGLLVGTVDISGMQVTMRLSEGKTMWQLHHDGEMEEHHAESGTHHVELDIVETDSGHDAHGGMTLSHSHVTLVAAAPGGEEYEFHLVPVQGGHGFRYESNAALPLGMYDLHLEVEPPSFLRSESCKDKWASHIDMDLGTFVFDGTFAPGTIAEMEWIGPVEDHVMVTLGAGDVKTYGAVGMGLLPLEGNETVNFSLRLEDPAVDAGGEPLFEALVTTTVINGRTGESSIGMLDAMYGDHGFHFGHNMHLGLGHIDEGPHDEGGEHGHP
jgi:uncharacterized protein involved in high-affinity Fe2+ transport